MNEDRLCPKCGSPMWDNRAKKASGEFSPKGPDFTCKTDRTHVIWPPRGNRPAQQVATYNGNPSWTEDAKITREKADMDTWQPGKLESLPIDTKALQKEKELVIAREAAGNALGRLYSGAAVPVDKFIELVDTLSTYYVSGKAVEEKTAEEVFDDNGKPMPWETDGE